MTALRWSEDALSILEHVVACRDAGMHCGLVVVTQTSGGALRAPGALAAVDETGSMVGYVSNGCVDGDIATQMLNAMDRGEPRIVRYGAGSPWQDIRLPCGGSMELVLVPDPDLFALSELSEGLRARRRQDLRLPRICDGIGKDIGARSFQLHPRPRLRLAGRGAPLIFTARAAIAADFAVSVASPDPQDLDTLSALALESATHLSVPTETPRFLDDAYTAVLLLFHDHEWEPALLIDALKGPAIFIGAMGSRKTHEARLNELRVRGVDEAQLSRITGPLGLVGSLRDANLIALSALAQIAETIRDSRKNPAQARAA